MRCSFAGAATLALLLGESAGFRRGRQQEAASAFLAGVPLYRSEGVHALEDQYMVSFGPEATDATLEAFCARSGPCAAMGHPSKGGIPFVVVKGSEKTLEASISAHQAQIAFVEQDSEAVDFEEADARSASWGLGAIGVPTARSTGKGVNVYVLDSGIRVTHQDFGGRAIPFYDATYSPPKVCDATDTECARDYRGHGSHVAGSVGGATFGVAPASTLLAMQRGGPLSDGFGCIDWLSENRKLPGVLQMSWGTGSMSQTAIAAVDAATRAGLTVTVASGNSNSDACSWTFGGIEKAISVASTDSTMSRSNFSNYGPCINILAPGSSIISADHRSDTGSSVKSGTSMAAPHVAGAAALILEASPAMSNTQVLEQLLANSAKDVIADAKSDNYFLQVGIAGPPAPAPAPTPPPASASCPFYCALRLCLLSDCVNNCDFCQ